MSADNETIWAQGASYLEYNEGHLTVFYLADNLDFLKKGKFFDALVRNVEENPQVFHAGFPATRHPEAERALALGVSWFIRGPAYELFLLDAIEQTRMKKLDAGELHFVLWPPLGAPNYGYLLREADRVEVRRLVDSARNLFPSNAYYNERFGRLINDNTPKRSGSLLETSVMTTQSHKTQPMAGFVSSQAVLLLSVCILATVVVALWSWMRRKRHIN